MLAAGTHTQAKAGFIKDEPHHDHTDEHQIGGGIGGEHIFQEVGYDAARAEHAVKQQRDLAGRVQRNGIGGIENGLGNHHSHTGGQKVDGRAGNGLVCAQIHAGNGVQHTEQRTGQSAAQKAEPGIGCVIAHRSAGECANGHHALDADVDYTRNL